MPLGPDDADAIRSLRSDTKELEEMLFRMAISEITTSRLMEFIRRAKSMVDNAEGMLP